MGNSAETPKKRTVNVSSNSRFVKCTARFALPKLGRPTGHRAHILRYHYDNYLLFWLAKICIHVAPKYFVTFVTGKMC